MQRKVVGVSNKMVCAFKGQKSKLKSSGRDLGRRMVTKQAKNSRPPPHISPSSFPSHTLHLSRKTPTDRKKIAQSSRTGLTNSFQANARQSCHCPVHTRPGGKTNRSTTKHRQTTNSSRRADKHLFLMILIIIWPVLAGIKDKRLTSYFLLTILSLTILL